MKIMNVLIIAGLIHVVLLSGCNKGLQTAGEVERPKVIGVTTETAALTQADEYVETAGTVKARTVSLIASRVMGTVTSVRVKEGDRVAAGQVLATIDDSDVVQKVKAAESAAHAAGQQKALAGITYQRYKNLHDDKALTGQELDQAETGKKVAELEYERASAMLREAKAYHGFTKLTAPVSGLVTEKKIDPGSTAVPGVPVFSVEDTSGYRVEAGIDEKYSGRVKKGAEVMVAIEALNREIKGAVTDVVQSVDPGTRTFLIRIAVSSEGLRNGFYAKVSVPAGRKEALLISRKAVVEKGQLTGVYVVDDKSVITYRLVRTGRTYGDRVEALSGLNPGEKIIVEGVDKAVDGGLLAQ